MKVGWRIGVTIAGAGLVVAGAAGIGYLVDTTGRDDAFVIESFDRDIVVQATGTLEVTETIDVRFTESRRGILRDLPVEGPAGNVTYTDITVDRGEGEADWPAALERFPDISRVRIGDPLVSLDPGAYTYRLQYEIRGLPFAVASSDDGEGAGAEVRIDVPGDRWPTEVEATTVRITGPADVLDARCVQGVARAIGACDGELTTDGNEVALAVGHLEPGETTTIAVQFPPDAFGPLPPPRDRIEPLGTGPPWLGLLEIERIPAAVLIALLFVLPFAVIQLVRAIVIYRDQKTDPALHHRQHPTALPAPPDGMRPPEVAGLLLRSDANALFLSTLVDLDQRGAIATAQTGEEGATTLTVLAGDPRAVPSDQDARLLGELQVGVLPLTFDGTYDASVSARVTAGQRNLARRARDVFADRGLLHTRGAWLMSWWFRTLQGLIVLGYLVVLGWAATRVTTFVPGAVAAILLVALTGYLVAMLPWKHHRLPLNSQGRDTVARARAFREYVESVESEQLEWAAGQPGIDHLHPAVSLLPYAIALGLADSWYDRFGEVIAELAARAPGAAAAGGAAWWAHQRSFSQASSTQSATTTAPASSSSGGGGGGGAGSGGGGGGGGSW